MNKMIIFTLVAITALWSCDKGSSTSTVADKKSQDTTLCQFSNIKQHKMFAYLNEEHDTLYFDNTFTALWPEVINGKSCEKLQQALLQSMTDSAELNKLDIVLEFLLNPGNYTDYDIEAFMPVKAIKGDDSKLSTSEISVIMESMTDRLLTYRLSTYSYMAGGAHGIYANNYVTYDLDSCKAVALNDIVADTTLLRTAILKSIKREYDYDTDQLFLPENGLLPLPRDFHIQDGVIHAVYQVYEIASYAQGMIDAPIYPYQLKPEEIKRLFTPYGLKLMDYDIQ